MAKRLPSANALKKRAIEDMKTLGVYRPEYVQIVDIYAKLIEQYYELKDVLTIDDLENRTDGVLTLEKLRTDIAKYSDMLCLNPKTFEKTKVKEAPKKSKLEAAMEMLSSG